MSKNKWSFWKKALVVKLAVVMLCGVAIGLFALLGMFFKPTTFENKSISSVSSSVANKFITPSALALEGVDTYFVPTSGVLVNSTSNEATWSVLVNTSSQDKLLQEYTNILETKKWKIAATDVSSVLYVLKATQGTRFVEITISPYAVDLEQVIVVVKVS